MKATKKTSTQSNLIIWKQLNWIAPKETQPMKATKKTSTQSNLIIWKQLIMWKQERLPVPLCKSTYESNKSDQHPRLLPNESNQGD